MTYDDLIRQYLYQSFPSTPATAKTKFEAVSSAVLGTKQRRFGPQLSPEAQVAIRKVITDTPEDKPLQFFAPWGASKQNLGHGLDIAEVSAIKQLACLQSELASYGRTSRFTFRLEDLTDRYLLGNAPARQEQIESYVEAFSKLATATLTDTAVNAESEAVTWKGFWDKADEYFPLFLKYLTDSSKKNFEALSAAGWKGQIPDEQRQYYRDAYRSFGYPSEDWNSHMARYFAATLARVRLNATRAPTSPFVLIAFTHPIPGNPIGTPRVYYRTIPEKFTNHHRSPWLAKGYLRIAGDNTVTPRVYVPTGEHIPLVPNRITWNGIEIEADIHTTE